MTGNMIKGKGFRGALRYNLEKVERGVAEVLDHSFVEASEKTIMKEIQMIRVMRPNLQKFFYHTSINFPPNENLTNAVMKQIGQDYLKESGFTQHQYIMFRHRDADHPHLHILVNRIGYDGKVLSDSNDFARCEKILRELEKRYNLTEVIASKQARERAMTKDELEMMKRTNIPSHKMRLQVIIKDVLASKTTLTCSEFIQALEAEGINILFNQASTGYVSGISYSYDGIIITGAKLGNDFKWTSIKNSIDYEQERDRTTIHQANVRTRSLNVNTRTSDRNNRGDQETIPELGVQNKVSASKYRYPRAGDENSPAQNRGFRHEPGTTQSKNIGNSHSFSEKSTAVNLASLLDGYSNGNLIHADHQPDLDNPYLRFKKRKRKKRRNRRI